MKLPSRNLFSLAKRERRARQQPGDFRAPRARLVIFGFYGLFTAMAVRAFVIQLFPPSAKSLHSIADRQYHTEVDLAPYRGGIYDRRNEPLAISIRLPSLAVNPHIFKPSKDELHRFARLLHMPAAQIDEITKKKSYFAWLKRKIPRPVADEIASLDIDGLHEFNEPARYYPARTAAAHLIGYVGLDDRGLMGLEREYENDLHGQAQKMALSRDARGEIIFFKPANATPEKAGNNIYLTIDRAIQEAAEEAVADGARAAKAKAAFAVVSDPHTGRILAIANYPQFDPNDTQHLDINRTKNSALLNSFEPGSVIKSVVISTAIEKGITRPDEVHNCEASGVYRVQGGRIVDDEGYGMQTTTGVLVHSSNICAYKIADKMGKETLYAAYKAFGIGSDTSTLNFPGEVPGHLSPWQNWKTIRFANVAFGYGFTVNAIEMVQAYGVIANGGNLMKPYIVDRIESSDGALLASNSAEIVHRVITPETAKSVREMLSHVVTEGTGKLAQTPDYTVAGKTGTSKKLDPVTKHYSTDRRTASFMGFAPVMDPRLVIYVVVDEPGQKPYFGGTWAAPIFSKIAEKSLKYLNVPPDKIPATALKVARKTKDAVRAR